MWLIKFVECVIFSTDKNEQNIKYKIWKKKKKRKKKKS